MADEKNGRTFVNTIIQGGAVGIAVLALLIIGWMSRSTQEAYQNHINHNTEQLTILNKNAEEQTKILERIDRKLDPYLYPSPQ